ncbi:ATP-binding protein [Streptomyces pinistramenti]|uniref:ATP-binding protein n=1 Tax=Streptomyces pinistramenti TaxID=2884812 RepID=UPI001D065036|nr:HAMP domain-containing sensor histidine kinase [Streptomyces pinistramenti]MCB5906160.1 HAMP domain-containing histidine kinase [Streptomyces pinistramenti]
MTRLPGPRTLRGRLALLALVTSALWIAVLTTAFNLALDKRLHEQADDVLRTRAEAVAATVAARPDGRLVVHEPAQDQALDAGVWIFQGHRAVDMPPGAPARLRRQADRLAGHGEGFAETAGPPGPTRLYAFPVGSVTGRRQVGTVVTSVSLDPYRSTADAALAGSLALAVLLLATVYLLTRLVVRRALRPVAAMSAQATRWAATGAPERFGPADRPAELSSLAAGLDALLDRLAAVLRHEQQQAAELSHELRTPLARITAETEWLSGRPRDACAQENSHRAIAGAAATMQQICDSLLSEARTRGAQTPGRCRFPDLAHQLSRRVAAEHPAAPPVRVEGDAVDAGVSAAVAERILMPLLDNARRYAVHAISLSCLAEAGAVTVYVGDDGPGVPEPFVPSLFEPGRRAHPEDGHDGAGLGLALARRLARAAGGDLTWAGTGQGARFAVTLPAG